MKLLGLTGNIACGKSSIASLLQARGAQVIDADALVHELYCDREFSSRVAALFGPGVLCRGKVNRRKLGEIVFADKAALHRLEALVHPAVGALRDEKLRALESTKQPPQVVVLEAVKLLESQGARGCVAVWCITCAPQIQLRRLMQTRGLDEKSARDRLDSQPPREEKQKLADAADVPLIFIENNGTWGELETKIALLWNELTKPDKQEPIS